MLLYYVQRSRYVFFLSSDLVVRTARGVARAGSPVVGPSCWKSGQQPMPVRVACSHASYSCLRRPPSPPRISNRTIRRGRRRGRGQVLSCHALATSSRVSSPNRWPASTRALEMVLVLRRKKRPRSLRPKEKSRPAERRGLAAAIKGQREAPNLRQALC